MRKGKPSVEDIKALITSCDETYSHLQDKYEKDERFYELEFKADLNIPKEFANEGIVLPTARDMVDTFVDHIDIGNARVFVNRKGTSNISMEEAEMMRKFYLGLIHRTDVESDISPWRVGAKHYATHGLAVFKTVWDADRWIDKPSQNDGESDEEYAKRIDEWRSETHLSIPIVIQAINPANINPDPGYGGRLYVIEKHKKLRYDANKLWPHWGNPKNKDIDGEVEYISYWDKDFRCDLVDGEPILKVRGGVVNHNYGFIPYVLIESGLGNLAKDAAPEKRYVGILRYMTDLLIAESRDFSISDIVLAKTAWPWFTLEGEGAESVKGISQRFGTVNKLPAGVKIVPQISQTPPDALRDHLYRTSDYIAAHAAPRSVRGLSEVGVRSGADRRLVIAEAAARYQYSKDAFKNGASKVLTNCAQLLKNVIPGDIRVWTRTPTDEFDIEIKKDKMKEPFTCYVEFAPISEEDEYRRHDDLERLVTSTIVTKNWARTQMSNVDAIQMELEEEKQKLKDDPNVQAIISQYVGGKLAEAISKRSGAEAIAAGGPPAPMAGQGAGAGRRMSPIVPERAPLGSAEAMQNQLKGLRRPRPTTQQGMGGGGNR